MDLVGREHELDDLVERLSRRRLVTVIGPAGIGKTSLARVAAARVGGTFPLGVHVVDLTSVDVPADVGGAMAAQLGVPSFAALVNSPTEQPVLLVVDNCEHVSDAAAAAIIALLEACPSPTVLATSRSPLDVPGESLVVLGPLALPPHGVVDTHAAAMRMFCDRARDAGASLPDDELEAAGELCRRLDGVPLAIEIVAARCRAMTPTEALQRLDHVDMLSRRRFRGTARHRSVRATVEWSYALLPGEQQRIFDRLGVFAGPFTASMAHAVCGELGDDPGRTVRALDSLVAASLLGVEPHRSTTSYRQLETLRRYARERLASTNSLHPTRERFVDHVVTLAVEVIDRARGGRDPEVLGELLSLFDNLAAALRWCLVHDDGGERALRLLAVLWGVVHQARVDDVGALGEAVLARWPDPRTPLWADAAATVATCRYLSGAPTDALMLAERALPFTGDSLLADVSLRQVMGEARRALGDTVTSAELFEQGAKEARARSADAMALELDVARAIVLADVGATDEALNLLREAHREAIERRSQINEVWARAIEGYVMIRTAPGDGIAVIDDALRIARRIDHHAAVMVSLRARALAQVATDHLDDAAQTVLDLLEELIGRGALHELRMVLETTAIVLARAGRRGWADLAAIARTLPIVNLTASVDHEVFPLPAHAGQAHGAPVLSRRDAIREARRLLREYLETRPSPATNEPAAADASFLLVGDLWELRFAGKVAYLKPSKGAVDLARLLSSPTVEIHCLELTGDTPLPDRPDPVIDGAAHGEHESRPREVHVEIDEAAERARSAVTQRLRATIRRIGDAHPQLARHLERSIATGTFCCYQPEHAIRWRT